MITQPIAPRPELPAAIAETPKAVRVGVLSPINKLDPRDAVDYVSAVVLGQVFDTPYQITGDASAKPLLFEPLRRDDAHGTQYSAIVRAGVRFSDGTPLTPEIAARSLRATSVLRNKATVEVRGGRVCFTLSSPNPRFELTLAQTSCAIVLDRGLQLLGTGPFVFDHRPNLRMLQMTPVVRLVRNPHYHGTTDVDEIQFHVLPAAPDGSPRSLIEALRSGEVDVTTALSAADLTTHRLSGLTAAMHPANSTAVLFMNSERRLLSSRDVRKGIACALDRHLLAAAAYDRNPAAFIAASVLPPSMGRGMGVPRFDRLEAARLLDESGARGAKLTMVIPWGPRPYLPKPLSVAVAIQKQLESVGITLSLVETRSSDEFFDALFSGRFDLALAGWIADTPDPADYFEALLWSKTIGSDNHSNYGRWTSEATDDALARFRSAPSDTNRQEIDRIIRDEAPLVPLMYGQSTVVHSRRLRNVTISPIGSLPLAEVTVGTPVIPPLRRP